MGFSDTLEYMKEHGGYIYYGHNMYLDFQDDRVVFNFPFGYGKTQEFEDRIAKVFQDEVIPYDSIPPAYIVGVGIEYSRVSDLLFEAFMERTKKM